MSLQRCASEIVSRVLCNLDGGTLLKCREVSHLFYSLIAEDVELQYVVELFKSGMADDSNRFPELSTGERLDKLQAVISERRGRIHLGEKDGVKMAVDFGGYGTEHQGDSFVRILADRAVGVRSITRDPGTNKVVVSPQRRYPIQPQGEDWGDGCVDISQDLVILMTSSTGFPLGIQVLSVSSESPHPLAMLPFIDWRPEDMEFEGPFDIKIVGDTFSISYTTPDEFTRNSVEVLVIFNWKIGENIFESRGHEAFIQLNSRFVLTCFVEKGPNRRYLQAHELDTSSIIIRFGLPNNNSRWLTGFLDGHTQPASHHVHDRRYPFYASSDYALLLLFTFTSSSSQIITAIPRSAFIEIIHQRSLSSSSSSSSDSVPLLPWGTWPQVSTTLPLQDHKVSLRGYRLAITKRFDPNTTRIEIFEFNPEWMRNGLDTGASSISTSTGEFKTVPFPPQVQDICIQAGGLRTVYMDSYEEVTMISVDGGLWIFEY